MADKVERWGIFELALNGPDEGNPFLDVELSVRFTYKNRVVEPDGFYDGEGVYRVRFMPDVVGEWRYVTRSSAAALDGVSGAFTCTEPSPGNHGPVSVARTHHFAYADGAPYFQVGTTCYAWVHQGDALAEQTLATLKEFPFNKLRMCVFPKSYTYSENEPETYPFAGTPPQDWDYARFAPEFFQNLERRVGDLMALGVEADVILFHPYDRWGFARMDSETNDRTLRYVVARLAAYRNVWWSMANEFDLMDGLSDADWDRFFHLVQACDPYQHLRSIHNCGRWYDHNKPWVTHASVQSHDVEKVTEWRERYRKPVVVDECRYEGNVESTWGNITAREMVRLFWEGTLRGGYVGHGETYLHPEDVLWWSKGGVLHGKSPERIAFYQRILAETPLHAFVPIRSTEIMTGWHEAATLRSDDCILIYFGDNQPGRVTFDLAGKKAYRVEIVDTWEMTVSELDGAFGGRFTVELPGKPYVAMRLQATAGTGPA